MTAIYTPVLKRIRRNSALRRAAEKLLQAAHRHGGYPEFKVARVERALDNLKGAIQRDCTKAATLGATEEEILCQIDQA